MIFCILALRQETINYFFGSDLNMELDQEFLLFVEDEFCLFLGTEFHSQDHRMSTPFSESRTFLSKLFLISSGADYTLLVLYGKCIDYLCHVCFVSCHLVYPLIVIIV